MHHRIGKSLCQKLSLAISAAFIALASLSAGAELSATTNFLLNGSAPTSDQLLHQLDDSPLDYTQLHNYQELVDALYSIESRSRGAVDVGPLIKNGENGGLIDIDNVYWGEHSLRQAVVDTVITDAVPSLGNTDPAKVGKSNKGRDLMAARFGHGPVKVVYITQQHGNEYIETEAALNFLRRLSYNFLPAVRRMERKISLLMIVRANPDGGEPDPERCQMGTPFPPLSAPDYDCAFYRFNVDPTAGTLPTRDPFRGAVGVGYNLNRYHVANLDKPIRPVENQAMVAAIKAFKPNFILDFHGDIPKVTCELDAASITPVIPGLLYDSLCRPGDDAWINHVSVRDMAEFLGQSDQIAQRWNGLITRNLDLFGVHTGRHRQFNEATEILNTAGDYSRLLNDGEPVHTMLLEIRNFSPLADPFVAGMNFQQNPPAPQIDFALNQVLGQADFFVGKLLSELIMYRGLNVIANGRMDRTSGDGGYADIPVDTGFIYQLSGLTLQTLGMDNPGPYIFPLCTLQPCLGE